MSHEYTNDTRDLLEDFEVSGVLNDEKKVLSFCCACCRLIWDELPKIAQEALKISEKYIKNAASVQGLINVRVQLWKNLGSDYMNLTSPNVAAIRAVICCLYEIKTMDEAFTTAAYAMSFCNTVKNKDAEQYQLLLKIFGDKK